MNATYVLVFFFVDCEQRAKSVMNTDSLGNSFSVFSAISLCCYWWCFSRAVPCHIAVKITVVGLLVSVQAKRGGRKTQRNHLVPSGNSSWHFRRYTICMMNKKLSEYSASNFCMCIPRAVYCKQGPGK